VVVVPDWEARKSSRIWTLLLALSATAVVESISTTFCQYRAPA